MIVAHNLSAMNAQRQFGIIGQTKSKTTEKLSSGYRINRAADDAAGLAISEKMRRQIRGLNQGAENIHDGISMVQVADGALSEVHDMLNRITELSVKAANGTLTAEDRSYLQSEVTGIVSEIQRIADTTTYNEINLFNDKEYFDQREQPITKLLGCDSAEFGKLREAYKSGGYYYPAAYIKFDGITENNINRLNGGNFTFHCSQNCPEVFDITFTTDGTPSSASNLGKQEHHMYSVDISGCKNGNEIVNRIYDYVSTHLPSTSPGAFLTEGVKVSHANNLIKNGSSLVIAANSGIASCATEEEAIKYYDSHYVNKALSGKVTCSTVMSEHFGETSRAFNIQCSSNYNDTEEVRIDRMNTNILGIDVLSVKTERSALSAINTSKSASAKISSQRSNLGAQQNRLEHALMINQNVSENTTAAESAIRDTDIAKEVVQNSMLSVLEQAGISMISQANQQNGAVLSLLG